MVYFAFFNSDLALCAGFALGFEAEVLLILRCFGGAPGIGTSDIACSSCAAGCVKSRGRPNKSEATPCVPVAQSLSACSLRNRIWSRMSNPVHAILCNEPCC